MFSCVDKPQIYGSTVCNKPTVWILDLSRISTELIISNVQCSPTCMYTYVGLLSGHLCLSDSSITLVKIMQRLSTNFQLIQHIVYNEAAMS